jgi:hypothetical protein
MGVTTGRGRRPDLERLPSVDARAGPQARLGRRGHRGDACPRGPPAGIGDGLHLHAQGGAAGVGDATGFDDLPGDVGDDGACRCGRSNELRDRGDFRDREVGDRH